MNATLYHGTTESRALEIQRAGFRSVSILDELKNLADEYDVDTDLLLSNLQKDQRFVVAPNRGDTAFFSGLFDYAASYASRGPEVLWEGLVYIYRIRHPEIGVDWNQSDELHWWVLRERLGDPPVVVEVTIPEAQLPCTIEEAERSIDMPIATPIPPSAFVSSVPVP